VGISTPSRAIEFRCSRQFLDTSIVLLEPAESVVAAFSTCTYDVGGPLPRGQNPPVPSGAHEYPHSVPVEEKGGK